LVPALIKFFAADETQEGKASLQLSFRYSPLAPE
jgi:hypothetical protein